MGVHSDVNILVFQICGYIFLHDNKHLVANSLTWVGRVILAHMDASHVNTKGKRQAGTW